MRELFSPQEKDSKLFLGKRQSFARKGFKDIPGFTLLNVKLGIFILSRLLSSFRNQVFGNY